MQYYCQTVENATVLYGGDDGTGRGRTHFRMHILHRTAATQKKTREREKRRETKKKKNISMIDLSEVNISMIINYFGAYISNPLESFIRTASLSRSELSAFLENASYVHSRRIGQPHLHSQGKLCTVHHLHGFPTFLYLDPSVTVSRNLLSLLSLAHRKMTAVAHPQRVLILPDFLPTISSRGKEFFARRDSKYFPHKSP
jgi:hypothetical protein